jgi:hypothetical protein
MLGEGALWDAFPQSKYVNVQHYIEKWHLGNGALGGFPALENFRIHTKDKGIDLSKTLHGMPNDIVIRIAMDLEVDTPGFLPSIPKFKNVLKEQNQSAYKNFTQAIKNVYENPAESVALATSVLEGIIKTILESEPFCSKKNKVKNLSLTKLMNKIVADLGLSANTNCPQEIKTIAAHLRGLGGAIDNLRSDKSTAHGKGQDDYVVDEPLWASFVVNTSATLGLFLWEYYEKKYKPAIRKKEVYQDPAAYDEDIPF